MSQRKPSDPDAASSRRSVTNAVRGLGTLAAVALLFVACLKLAAFRFEAAWVLTSFSGLAAAFTFLGVVLLTKTEPPAAVADDDPAWRQAVAVTEVGRRVHLLDAAGRTLLSRPDADTGRELRERAEQRLTDSPVSRRALRLHHARTRRQSLAGVGLAALVFAFLFLGKYAGTRDDAREAEALLAYGRVVPAEVLALVPPDSVRYAVNDVARIGKVGRDRYTNLERTRPETVPAVVDGDASLLVAEAARDLALHGRRWRLTVWPAGGLTLAGVGLLLASRRPVRVPPPGEARRVVAGRPVVLRGWPLPAGLGLAWAVVAGWREAWLPAGLTVGLTLLAGPTALWLTGLGVGRLSGAGRVEADEHGLDVRSLLGRWRRVAWSDVAFVAGSQFLGGRSLRLHGHDGEPVVVVRGSLGHHDALLDLTARHAPREPPPELAAVAEWHASRRSDTFVTCLGVGLVVLMGFVLFAGTDHARDAAALLEDGRRAEVRVTAVLPVERDDGPWLVYEQPPGHPRAGEPFRVEVPRRLADDVEVGDPLPVVWLGDGNAVPVAEAQRRASGRLGYCCPAFIVVVGLALAGAGLHRRLHRPRVGVD